MTQRQGTVKSETAWQVRLPDGSLWIPQDAQQNTPRASWIYARSTAEMFARQLGGEVVEVSQRQRDKALDQEISTSLAKQPKKQRPLGREARRAIAAAIAEYVGLPPAAREALATARETADSAEYAAALKLVAAALPATLWASYDRARDEGIVQTADPIWSTADPAGEDRAAWRQVDRADVARWLVEDV